MSDSLSMTSALALGGAAGAAGKALEKARSMFNATNELSFLINEVSNIQLIMVGLVEELRLRKERNTFQVQLTDALATLLRATTEELQELEKVIYYDLVKYGEKNEIHANKIAWAQEQRKIQGFRTRLRNHRMNLVAQVGVVTLSDLSKFKLTLDEIALVSNRTRSTQDILQERFNQILDEHTQKLNELGVAVGVIHRMMLSTPVNIDQVPCDQEQTQSRGADSETSSTHMRMSLRAMSSLCKNWCNCSCHLRRSVQTPSIVRGVLGKLFFDYTGVPILSSKCDQRACLQQPKRSARVTFYFPSWFLARVFVASLMYTGQRGPELLLRLPRVLPPRSEIFHFAETGNVGGIHQLFRTGKASVYDVDSSGSTILHFALNTRKYHVCRLLVDYGADIEFDSPQDRKPVDIAWDSILARFEIGDNAELLASAFKKQDHIESRNFSILHKCILGLLQLELDQLLQGGAGDIDKADADGRTALVWASLRGDSKALSTLLQFDADPNKCDNSGKTALHHARNAACTDTLLRSAPNIDQRDYYGRTALHTACRRQGDLERVRLLLNAGADLNILDNWNRTPISYLSQFDGAEIAKLLFEHARGTLDLGIADVGGFTPIMTAIESNSYNILDFLLGVVDRDVLVKKNKKDETVLHLLMRCADEETLLLFLNHNLQHFRSEDLGCIDSQALTIQAAKDCRWNQESRDSMIANRIIEKIRCQDEACEDEFFDALEDLT